MARFQQLYQFAPPGPPLIAPLIQPPPQFQPAVSAALSFQHAAHAAAAAQAMHSLQHPPPPVTQAEVVQVQQPQVQQNLHQGTSQQYLLSAWRVGMLALDSLIKRVSEERGQYNKFARIPNYGDDVKWLLDISKRLGLNYLYLYIEKVLSAPILSPFLLQDLAQECAKYFAQQSFPGYPASPDYRQHLRANANLQPLINRCYDFYNTYFYQRLYHIAPPDYDDFISTLKHAKQAFSWTQHGIAVFGHLLGKIKA